MTFSAKKAWFLLAVYILVADFILIKINQCTMSSQFLTWASDPVRRFVTAIVTGYIVCHLYNKPKYLARYDPLSVVANLLRGKISISEAASQITIPSV